MKRTYTHVFATHAILQERLAAAIVAQLGVDAGNVLVIKVRNSYQPEDNPPFTTLDGGRFMRVDGWNLPRNRARNREVYTDFDREVLQNLAPDFQVYSAMYTYWFVRLLGIKAAAYHILEDGFGSYQSLEEFGKIFSQMSAFRWRRELGKVRTRLAADSRQMIPFPDPYDHLRGAGRYFVTSPHCFPFVEAEKRVVLEGVFPPRYVGEYAGAVVLATSSLVGGPKNGGPWLYQFLFQTTPRSGASYRQRASLPPVFCRGGQCGSQRNRAGSQPGVSGGGQYHYFHYGRQYACFPPGCPRGGGLYLSRRH